MKAHTMFFKELQKGIRYIMGISYDPMTREFGCLLALDKEPPKYKEFFAQENGIHVYKYGVFSCEPSLKFDFCETVPKDNGQPKQIDIVELSWEIEQNGANTVIYTGAGLSIKAGIMGLQELKDSLFLNRLDQLLEVIINQIEILQRNFATFIISLYFANPTSSHYVLTKLQEKYNFLLLTENRDILHQKTNAKVIERDKYNLNNFAEKTLLITVGLDKDYQGIISYFINLNCKIIAINIKQPEYLHSDHYWLKGDIHECLTQLGGVLIDPKLERGF